jgi:hypothetical protein
MATRAARAPVSRLGIRACQRMCDDGGAMLSRRSQPGEAGLRLIHQASSEATAMAAAAAPRVGAEGGGAQGSGGGGAECAKSESSFLRDPRTLEQKLQTLNPTLKP